MNGLSLIARVSYIGLDCVRELSVIVLQEIIELLRSIDRRLALIANCNTDNSSPTVNPNHSYSRAQTARFLNVSTWTVDKARKDGLLVEARRVGKRDVRITGESIMEFHRQAHCSSVRVQKY